MRKVLDDKGRLFGRVSIIDLLVLVVAIVIIVAAYTKFNVFDSPASTTSTVAVTYTVRIPAIRSTNANLLRVGDSLYSLDTGTNVGVITNIEITEAIGPEFLVDGTIIEERIEDRLDVLLTVLAQCSHSNGRYYANRSFELNANAQERFFTKYNEIAISTIMSISTE